MVHAFRQPFAGKLFVDYGDMQFPFGGSWGTPILNLFNDDIIENHEQPSPSRNGPEGNDKQSKEKQSIISENAKNKYQELKSAVHFSEFML